MAMNRAQFARQLQEGLNTVFGLEYEKWPEEWREIFDIETSQKAYEEDVLMQGLGAAQVKEEGAGVAYDSGSELWARRYTHETIALAFAITEEAEEDNLYMAVGKRYAESLAMSMQYTKELKGAAVLNNAFSASYPGGDGVALCSTAHPLGNGSTFANKLATPADLHEAALEDASIGVSKFTNERSIPVALRCDKIVIPPDLEFIAERVLNSPMRPGTADNDVNAINKKGKFPGGYCINHYLTDLDSWYIRTTAKNGFKHFRRVKLQRKIEGEFESGNMRYRARERYVFGFTDPRCVYASEGAG